MLMDAVDSYLAVRRAAGFELEVPEYLLRSFARSADERGDTHVCTETAIDWASQAPSLGQRDHRLKTVMRMARHLQIEDDRHQVPPRDVFGFTKTRRVPYIFSQTEINRLIEAAAQLGPPGSLRPRTYSTLDPARCDPNCADFAALEAFALRLDSLLPMTADIGVQH